MAAHLRRIAGSHVRNSATVGGNLVLARLRGLPSDVATLLLAAGSWLS
jgi:abscisic-aldehyde oxidase